MQLRQHPAKVLHPITHSMISKWTGQIRYLLMFFCALLYALLEVVPRCASWLAETAKSSEPNASTDCGTLWIGGKDSMDRRKAVFAGLQMTEPLLLSSAPSAAAAKSSQVTSQQIKLCYAVLCYAMLCHTVLCHAAPCYAMLCFAVLCCAVLCHAVLCHAMLCYAVLCYIPCHLKLCCAVLCCAMQI